MFSGIRRFFKRHQYKFLIGSAVFGGVIFLSRYAQHKMREWQQREIRALLERSRKLQHFEHLEKTCDQISSALAVNVKNTIIKELDTKTIINQLKLGSTDKVTLWNELKILSITRSIVIVYAYTMLVTFLRIQIYLLSGHMYLNQISTDVEDDIRAQYLKLSSYFISEGVQELCSFIKNKVKKITSSISLNDKLNLRELEQMYRSIVSSIYNDSSADPIKNFASYTISRQDYDGQRQSMYSKIIDQTLDLLESEEVQILTQSNIRSGIATLIDHISVYFDDSFKTENYILQQCTTSKKENLTSINLKGVVAMNNGSNTFININATVMAMAKIIPIISKQVSDNSIQKDISTDILERLMLSNEIKTFGANIYEAFSCKI